MDNNNNTINNTKSRIIPVITYIKIEKYKSSIIKYNKGK
jgi:hypothetical protein